MSDWPREEQMKYRLMQGTPCAGVEVRIVGEHGEDLPWDGEQVGELLVRGPWVASSYYKNPAANVAFTEDGWFRTGDMAAMDPLGYVQLTDRKKDLIKRKGEWISSVDMENAVTTHPGVLEAAVVGRPDEICVERPVVLAVRKSDAGQSVKAQDIIDLLSRKFARWQLPLPQDVIFVAALPKTSVGKLDKKLLRKMLAEKH